jgi:hypothetical protein
VVIYSAYDRDPKLLSSHDLNDLKGLTELKNYARRAAGNPDVKFEVARTGDGLIPEQPPEATEIEPQSTIGQSLDRAEPPQELSTDRSQAASLVYNEVLKAEFAKSTAHAPQKTINGIRFQLKPSEKETGSRSVTINTTPNKKRSETTNIGTVKADGTFEPNPNINNPEVLKALDRVLTARGIDPQAVVQTKEPDLLQEVAKIPEVGTTESVSKQKSNPEFQESPKTSQNVNFKPVPKPVPKPKERTEVPTAAERVSPPQGIEPQPSTKQPQADPKFPPLNQQNSPAPNSRQASEALTSGNNTKRQNSSSPNTVGVKASGSERVEVQASGDEPERAAPTPERSQQTSPSR